MKTSKLLQALAALAIATTALALPAASMAAWGVSVSVGFAPPVLPVYVQPPCPAPGYMWTPGYWAYDPDSGYYWVPGTWVLAPAVGLLWTPGYWGFEEAVYVWHPGYWGRTIGFYGGVNYGFGYSGRGFEGGRWDHDRFLYNRAAVNVGGVSITNVYMQPLHEHGFDGHVSYNGGPGGVRLAPTDSELAALRAPHYAPTADQERHVQVAHMTPSLRASVNHGRPSIASAPRAGVFAHEPAQSRPEIARGHAPGGQGQPYAAGPSRQHEAPRAVPQERAREPAGKPEAAAPRAEWNRAAQVPAARAQWNRAAQAPAPRAAWNRSPAVPEQHAAFRPAPERASAPQRGGREAPRREPQRG